MAIAAPVLALVWAADAALGLIARAAPGLPLQELASPLRLLGGAGMLWLALGLVADRLLESVAKAPLGWTALLGGRA
jgi:flagellar biosynthesis protein FliR